MPFLIIVSIVAAITTILYRKDHAMSEIDNIKAQIAKMESGASTLGSQAKALLVGSSGVSSWMSRKLLVAIAALVVIVILGPTMGEMMKIVKEIVISYIWIQGLVDISANFSNAWVRGKVADGLAFEGKLTDGDATTLSPPMPPTNPPAAPVKV